MNECYLNPNPVALTPRLLEHHKLHVIYQFANKMPSFCASYSLVFNNASWSSQFGKCIGGSRAEVYFDRGCAQFVVYSGRKSIRLGSGEG